MKRTKGSLAWKIFVGILAALLVLILVAEFGLRAFISSQIESQFEEAAPAPTTQDAQVSFGSAPLTLGLLGGKVPHMTLSVPSTLVLDGESFSGQPAATVEMDGVRMTDAGTIADTLNVSTELPDAFVRVILQQQLGSALAQVNGVPTELLQNSVTVSDVTSNPAEGTVTIQLTDGLAAIDLRPEMEGDQLTFSAESTRLFGIDLPGGVAERISQALREGMRDVVFGSMRVQDFTVIEGGLRVTLSGHNVNLNEINQAL
ncbi:DUF2993 domain-containing protein [Corynebacterium qintianiae]|uniref:DUF2993 domain-containing protein n=1 Tax=Corynebacterium qintianiae TaxID=2709392 RepID=A0A7T0KMG4_9CORY|nr:DUF2993 domain-containing protein [Corynebacterium qintianiae]QPK83451.1 DUF2993 domain-containing protein [Corynebacterium qintianiae]